MSEYKKIKLSEIDSFKNHPYKVERDESFNELMDSIKSTGLLNPLIVRTKENGRYEMISGHRRKLALELLGEKEVSVNIKELSDEEATILMVDSNISRERILPSEKAFAYKMKMEAIKHQGKSTYGPEVRKLEKESDRNIRRYIRLTYLIPELLKLVDDTVLKDKRSTLTMGIKPAVELSYLSKEEQKLVYLAITYEYVTPSLKQAMQIREMSREKKIVFDDIEDILCEEKGNQHEQISFNKENVEKVLPTEILKRDKRYIEQYIIKALEFYRANELESSDDYDLNMKVVLNSRENDKLKLKTLEPILKKIFKDKFNIKYEINEQKRINMLINLDKKITVNEKILINSKIKKEYFHVEIILEKENTFIYVYPKNISYLDSNDLLK